MIGARASHAHVGFLGKCRKHEGALARDSSTEVATSCVYNASTRSIQLIRHARWSCMPMNARRAGRLASCTRTALKPASAAWFTWLRLARLAACYSSTKSANMYRQRPELRQCARRSTARGSIQDPT